MQISAVDDNGYKLWVTAKWIYDPEKDGKVITQTEILKKIKEYER